MYQGILRKLFVAWSVFSSFLQKFYYFYSANLFLAALQTVKIVLRYFCINLLALLFFLNMKNFAFRTRLILFSIIQNFLCYAVVNLRFNPRLKSDSVCSAHGFIARAIAAPLNHVPSQDSLLNGISAHLTAFAINCSNHFRSPSLSGWWAQMDSDHRPHAYQACALTSWAMSPCVVEVIGFEPMTPCLQGRCSTNWAIPPFSSQIFPFAKINAPRSRKHAFY